MKRRSADQDQDNQNRRFLQCPGSVTVAHIKKLIMTKYGLDQTFLVDVIYKEDLLPEDQTLIDVAYSYNWRKVNNCVLVCVCVFVCVFVCVCFCVYENLNVSFG